MTAAGRTVGIGTPLTGAGVRADLERDARWADHYDPVEICPALSDDQWHAFETTTAATVAFAERARAARDRDRRTAPGAHLAGAPSRR